MLVCLLHPNYSIALHEILHTRLSGIQKVITERSNAILCHNSNNSRENHGQVYHHDFAQDLIPINARRDTVATPHEPCKRPSQDIIPRNSYTQRIIQFSSTKRHFISQIQRLYNSN